MLSAEIIEERERLLHGIKNLQIAFLIEIIVGIVAIPSSLFKLFTFLGGGHLPFIGMQWSAYFFINSIISLIGGIIIFYFLYRGFENIKESITTTSIGTWGAVLKLIALIISFLLTIFLISYLPRLMGGSIQMENIIQVSIASSVTAIIGLVGGILIAIALYHIGDEYNESLVTVGGILYIFLAWIAAILLFIGLKNVEKKALRGKPGILPPPPPPF